MPYDLRILPTFGAGLVPGPHPVRWSSVSEIGAGAKEISVDLPRYKAGDLFLFFVGTNNHRTLTVSTPPQGGIITALSDNDTASPANTDGGTGGFVKPGIGSGAVIQTFQMECVATFGTEEAGSGTVTFSWKDQAVEGARLFAIHLRSEEVAGYHSAWNDRTTNGSKLINAQVIDGTAVSVSADGKLILLAEGGDRVFSGPTPDISGSVDGDQSRFLTAVKSTVAVFEQAVADADSNGVADQINLRAVNDDFVYGAHKAAVTTRPRTAAVAESPIFVATPSLQYIYENDSPSTLDLSTFFRNHDAIVIDIPVTGVSISGNILTIDPATYVEGDTLSISVTASKTGSPYTATFTVPVEFGPSLYIADDNGAGFLRTETVTEATYDGVTFTFNQPVKVGHFHMPANFRRLPGQLFFTKANPADPVPQVTGWTANGEAVNTTEDSTVFRHGAMYPLVPHRYGTKQGFWFWDVNNPHSNGQTGANGGPGKPCAENAIARYDTATNAGNNLPLVMEDRKSLVVGVTRPDPLTQQTRSILQRFVALTYVDAVPEDLTVEFPKIWPWTDSLPPVRKWQGMDQVALPSLGYGIASLVPIPDRNFNDNAGDFKLGSRWHNQISLDATRELFEAGGGNGQHYGEYLGNKADDNYAMLAADVPWSVKEGFAFAVAMAGMEIDGVQRAGLAMNWMTFEANGGQFSNVGPLRTIFGYFFGDETARTASDFKTATGLKNAGGATVDAKRYDWQENITVQPIAQARVDLMNSSAWRPYVATAIAQSSNTGTVTVTNGNTVSRAGGSWTFQKFTQGDEFVIGKFNVPNPDYVPGQNSSVLEVPENVGVFTIASITSSDIVVAEGGMVDDTSNSFSADWRIARYTTAEVGLPDYMKETWFFDTDVSVNAHYGSTGYRKGTHFNPGWSALRMATPGLQTAFKTETLTYERRNYEIIANGIANDPYRFKGGVTLLFDDSDRGPDEYPRYQGNGSTRDFRSTIFGINVAAYHTWPWV